MADSSIEWTDKTWNPVTGCSKVSPGCAHCYAEALTMRYAKTWKVPGLPWTPENAEQNVILKPERLGQPRKWATPSRVFVNSMSDLFHELIPDEYIDQVFRVMGQTQRHTYQVLTKRPERACEYLADRRWRNLGFSPQEKGDMYFPVIPGEQRDDDVPLPNVWIGTSIENRRFVHRADALRETPAAVRFISAEPLLGGLTHNAWHGDASSWSDGYDGPELDLTDIDWLIVGGESGKGHRPFDWDWARQLKYHCELSHTAFFLKQGGGHRPGDRMEDLPEDLRIREYPSRRSSGMKATIFDWRTR